MLKRSILVLILFFATGVFLFGSDRTDSLRMKIEQMIAPAKGNVGVAVLCLEKNDTVTVNGNGRYPMQSAYKLPIGLAVLAQVDKRLLSLDQRIYLKKEDVRGKTWSPLREKYPNGDTAVVLDEIVTFTVAQSDNNGCDILLRLLGGPGTVDRFIHEAGVKDMAIANTEEEMGKDNTLQYRNFSSPIAMAQLLSMMYRGKILSAKNTEHIVTILEQTTTGPKRLKGLLPKGTVVAHKTGSSGTDEHGITAATNDAGIITLPDGRHVIVVVFVSNSPAEESVREGVIANVAKAVWDFYGSP